MLFAFFGIFSQQDYKVSYREMICNILMMKEIR